MKVTLPPVFRINEKEDGNLIQQIVEPSRNIDATFEEHRARGLRGYVLRESESSSVLISVNNANPETEFSHVIYLKGLRIDSAETASLDLIDSTWIRHPSHLPALQKLADYQANVAAVRETWADGFHCIQEDPGRNVRGLRPPQIGAIYAIQSHWTIHSDPATVVLPTGVGKTETMLSVLVAERCQRLLVVVPTEALKIQIYEKFLTFGLLKTPEFRIVAPTAAYPVVGSLNHRPKDVGQVDSLFQKCNVVVTTMPLAGQCELDIVKRMAALCPCLFIDEAHHVAAPRWNAFKDEFNTSKIIQFTATPFRNDDKPIGGRRIFTFSLRQAQEQGYFKKINFRDVDEFDPSLRDKAVAEAAVEQLRKDHDLGHILMARVNSVARAEEVFEFYKQYSQYNPVQVHTGIKSKSERESIRRKLLSGESRIVVCVDMLGEGFDLPELKIAAFHDIRKSLPVTLQLAGRFTRSKPHLGDATFVANIADPDVKDELRKLYQHEPDWNVLLPALSENASQGEFNLWEFLGGFNEIPGDIPLKSVRPSMSTVVYKTKCKNWTPENFSDGIMGFDKLEKVYFWPNYQENVAVIATMEKLPVEWAQTDEVYSWDWQLYVLHWHQELGLLFIHNSSNSGFFKKLAKAVVGKDAEQISGPSIFRCLANINRMRLQNVGVLEHLGRLIRYTMRAGSNVEPAMSDVQKQKAIKANLFGQGFSKGHRTTIGCSYKGRIWSYRKTNLFQFTSWCHEVGSKLADESLDPNEVLKGTLEPVLIFKRPEKMPIGIEWPDVFYREPERSFGFTLNKTKFDKCDTELALVDPSIDGPLLFAVKTDEEEATYEIVLTKDDGSPSFTVNRLGDSVNYLNMGTKMIPLESFFEDEPPTFWFADGSSLTGCEFVALKRQAEPYPLSGIETWNWAGTNIRHESQKSARRKDSVQYRVIAELKAKGFDVIYDDDGSGEVADVVAIKELEGLLAVEFWHCKYSKKDKPGHRIDELYEVCGQAQNSIRWLEKKQDLFTHLLRREPRKFKGAKTTRFEVGSKADLLRIREKAGVQELLLRVAIVQPGLSKAEATYEQLELLAITDNYLKETFEVPFKVIASP